MQSAGEEICDGVLQMDFLKPGGVQLVHKGGEPFPFGAYVGYEPSAHSPYAVCPIAACLLQIQPFLHYPVHSFIRSFVGFCIIDSERTIQKLSGYIQLPAGQLSRQNQLVGFIKTEPDGFEFSHGFGLIKIKAGTHLCQRRKDFQGTKPLPILFGGDLFLSQALNHLGRKGFSAVTDFNLIDTILPEETELNQPAGAAGLQGVLDRKSTRLNSSHDN